MKHSQIYSGLPINIGCASLSFKRLDKKSLKILKSASIDASELVTEEFKKKLGFDVEQVSVIQKCNAVIIMVVYSLLLEFLQLE